MPRQSIKIERVCETCHATFHVYPSNIHGTGGRFCSRTCYNGAGDSLETRFRRYVGIPNENGCILWTGATSKAGYGVIQSQPPAKREALLAHRLSWEFQNGPIPDGLCVLHRCDNPPCIAIDHLFLGTKADNTADMMVKDRCGTARLTSEQVRQIRDRYAAGGITYDSLAREYGVSFSNIGMIISRRTWNHI